MLVQTTGAFNVDQLANEIARWGAFARRMPPGWDGIRSSIPIHGPGGQWIGRLLPGTGVALAMDLKDLGITKPIPGILERTRVERLREWMATLWPVLGGRAWYDRRTGQVVHPEQAAVKAAGLILAASLLSRSSFAPLAVGLIQNYPDIINARANGKANDVVISKTSLTTVAQGFSSLYRAGGLPSAGTYTAIPGGAVHTALSAGAWSQGLSSPGADKKYLLTFGFGSSSSIDWGLLVDLLVCAGNISATIATAQTVNSVAQTRQYTPTLGAMVMGTYEVTTALGTGTPTITCNYTNQAGTAGRVTPTTNSIMTASAIVNRLMPAGLGPFFELQAGDFGIRSVETVTLSAGMSAGVLALNLFSTLSFVPGIGANLYVERDSTVQIDAINELVKDVSNNIGCLTMFVQTNSTSSGGVRTFLRTVSG